MQIKAVLFDMFDTLMLIKKNHDFYSPSLMRMYKYLNNRGIDVSFEVFKKAYVKERDDLYAKADPTLEEPHFNVRVAATLKSLGYDYGISSRIVVEATAQFCEEFMKFVYLDEYANAVLCNLQRKYKLGIISNFAIPECIEELLSRDGLKKVFDVVLVSAVVNKRKPSPEIFHKAIRALGTSASETVFVGDTVEADIEGAKAVGMKAIYIKRRVEQAPTRVQPDQTIKSLSELPLLLEKL
jgi:putative hydrolase of the HAD superfamily